MLKIEGYLTEMFFPDLDARELGDGYKACTVGWLTNTQLYATGPTAEEFMPVLRQHLDVAWQPFYCAGWHDCELCVGQPVASSFNLFIPAGSILYYAPVMIEHYICVHHYQPPQEFVNAVVACPAQGTQQYFQAIRPFAERWRLLRSAL